ncbi:MAG: hypothetical protein KFW07_00885 [Mycoplasmataceae bacterium]|nr:hypothetical protein [Mycoplasmataceae bacterium]
MKKKILFLSILTPIVFIPLISLSMKINNEIKVSDSHKSLKEGKQHENHSTKLNLDGFDSNKIVKYKITQEEFSEIAQKAQKNPIVLNWMTSVLKTIWILNQPQIFYFH